jgi:inosose dehydratase
VNSKLHVRDEAERSIEDVLAIVERCIPLGVRTVVTNPSPIEWGSAENKSDAEIRDQAQALDRLGAMLRERDLTLAYHTHDSEFRAGAREFHHMMLATDPANVSFCLDVHWVYRGSGHSNVALFDVLELYGSRVVELHIRQSQGHIWSESFGEGDIDYPEVVRMLVALDLKPHLVLEQAVEAGTPHTVPPLEAHRASQAYARKVFAPLNS